MNSQVNNQESNEYLCVTNNQVPLVRILNLKIIDRYDTQRHFDTILIQCIPRVGPKRNTTTAHIELVDHNKHYVLKSMLSGYY